MSKPLSLMTHAEILKLATDSPLWAADKIRVLLNLADILEDLLRVVREQSLTGDQVNEDFMADHREG